MPGWEHDPPTQLRAGLCAQLSSAALVAIDMGSGGSGGAPAQLPTHSLTRQRRGTSLRSLPLSNSRSFRRVRRAFRMAELACKEREGEEGRAGGMQAVVF